MKAGFALREDPSISCFLESLSGYRYSSSFCAFLCSLWKIRKSSPRSLSPARIAETAEKTARESLGEGEARPGCLKHER